MPTRITCTMIGFIELNRKYVANPDSSKLNYDKAKHSEYVPVGVYSDGDPDKVICEYYYNGILHKGQPNNPDAPIYTHKEAIDFIQRDYILKLDS